MDRFGRMPASLGWARIGRVTRGYPADGGDGAVTTGPDFDVDFGPELDAAMAEHLAAVEAIATGPWPPTFEDTIVALERAGRRLHRAEWLLDDAASARATPAVQALEADVLPRMAAHHDAVGLDPRVFARIDGLAGRAGELGLGEEERCVLDRYHRELVRAGVTL